MLNYVLIPFAIAWLLRSAASAIAISLGFLWLPWMLAPVLPVWVEENVLRYLPDVAANSLSGITSPDSAQYLSQAPAIGGDRHLGDRWPSRPRPSSSDGETSERFNDVAEGRPSFEESSQRRVRCTRLTPGSSEA